MAGQTGPRAADRTLEVLELVAGAAAPVSAKALARGLGCALSTVYTLLAPLTDRGYLVRTDGGYTLGYQVAALHRAFRRQAGLTDGADGIDGVLARMRHATRASANYVAYQGDGLVVADVRTVAADGDEQADLAVGVDPRSHAYAHGKIALAAAGAAARRRYVEQPGLRRFTPNTIASAERLDEELRRIRRTGVALDVEEARAGLACLAAPVLGTDGAVIGSVSLAVRPEDLRTRRHQLIAAVKQAAREASPAQRT
ncbi:IclR family transcriptional regulator C-terminal domain-containing protein [Streptomyces sp. SP17BM10]|uniref:IclR family transcriptional regulator n=1 Tax=Streptomyces sp. SP17BM10 TaxID=3002530 RepID=UPI002E789054|nr:IclR family transcriptional regulator C-terminal domain-containing protein [Streptomyces sp. SP17BM10]MEE1783190.1 IclR family transcriptional regulator C-terminal domain-containing protein [Streptomyces sp. SP17BM10]